ncbi:MAG: acyltransferase [Paludibacteraceae bacterium]|nr:acyltransferase [Paludibacteraceae bacterium]
MKKGRNAVFHFRTEIRDPRNLEVGDGCIIGDNAILDARHGLVLGKNVNLSSNVSIYTRQHDYRNPNFACIEPVKRRQDVKIGDRAWLGCNVVVLPGVTIGEGAVCCAGCVVTKDVAPFSVVAGIPAQEVAQRPQKLVYEFKGRCGRFY